MGRPRLSRVLEVALTVLLAASFAVGLSALFRGRTIPVVGEEQVAQYAASAELPAEIARLLGEARAGAGPPTPVALRGGWQRFEFRDLGYSIAVPPDWYASGGSSGLALMNFDLSQLPAAHPKRPLADQLAARGSVVLELRVARNALGSGQRLEEWLAGARPPQGFAVQQRGVTVGGHAAAERSTLDTAGRSQWREYWVAHGRDVLTITVWPAWGAGLAQAEAVVSSLRLEAVPSAPATPGAGPTFTAVPLPSPAAPVRCADRVAVRARSVEADAVVGAVALVDVWLDNPSGLAVDGVSVALQYDPSVLRMVDPSGREVDAVHVADLERAWETRIYNEVDNGAGRVMLALGNRLGGPPLTGSRIPVATLRFRASAPTSRTDLTLVGSPAGTDVACRGQSVRGALEGGTMQVVRNP